MNHGCCKHECCPLCTGFSGSACGPCKKYQAIVAGFTGACAVLNGTYVLPFWKYQDTLNLPTCFWGQAAPYPNGVIAFLAIGNTSPPADKTIGFNLDDGAGHTAFWGYGGVDGGDVPPGSDPCGSLGVPMWLDNGLGGALPTCNSVDCPAALVIFSRL